jgi:HEAT repeat protein
MVDAVAASDALGSRKFVHDALARTPDAYPMIVPLLGRSAVHQVRHAAALLGRLGNPRSVGPLTQALRHADAGVRGEAARSLARFDDSAARAALTEALAHASATTRGDVAAAIGAAGRTALAPALMTAFRSETDGDARRAMAGAAAQLGTPAALEELVQVALARRILLLRKGYSREVRLDATAGLAVANTPAARRCLDRLAREADRPVREAADRALSVRRGR